MIAFSRGKNTFSATCIFNMVWMAFLIHFGHLGNVTKNNKCFPSLFTIYVVSCYWVPMLTFISAVCIPEILFCDGPGLRPDVGQHGDGQLEILLGRKKLERAGRHGLVARHGHQQQLHRGRGPKPISGKSQVCGWLWALKESQKTTTKKVCLKKFVLHLFLFFSRLADSKLLLIYKIVFSLTGLSMNLKNILYRKKFVK